jgi:hypothetical protein
LSFFGSEKSSHFARFIEAFLGMPQVAKAYRLGDNRAISCENQDALQIAEQPWGKTEIDVYSDGSHIAEPIFVIGNLSKMRTNFSSQAMNIILNYTIAHISNLLRQHEAERL